MTHCLSYSRSAYTLRKILIYIELNSHSLSFSNFHRLTCKPYCNLSYITLPYLRTSSYFNLSYAILLPYLTLPWLSLLSYHSIIISKLLKRHLKAKRRAPVYSWALH